MRAIYFLLLISATIVACGTASMEPNAAKEKQAVTAADYKSSNEVSTQLTDSTVSGSVVQDEVYNGAKPVFDWDKKIIKTANMQAECKEYKLYNQKLRALVKQYGGWIASEAEVQRPERLNNTFSVKVPVPQFDELVTAISALDGKLLEKQINTQDVTGQMTDTKARIEARKQVREKYMEFLKQAKTMEDVLKVQLEINDVHEEIEVASSSLQSLQHQSSFSTVNINFYQLLDAAGGGGSDKPGFGSRLLSAVSNGGSWLLDVLVGLMNIWPLIIAGGLFFFYLKRKVLVPSKRKPGDAQVMTQVVNKK
jgi:hypothetical protein